MGIIGKITKCTNYNPMNCLRVGLLPLILLTNQKIKLISSEGATRVIKGHMKIKAGEIMFEFPDCVVCHADSFFLGKPIPILSIHDHLVAGHTYFVLPLDRLQEGGGGSSGGGSGALLSAALLCSLGSPSSSGGCPSGNKGPPNTMLKLLNGSNYGSNSPFEYVKDKDGRVLMIKVIPEFITRIITTNYGSNNTSLTNNSNSNNNMSSNNLICSTPELQKQYEQLVRAKEQAWSPKLETITEHKAKFSPLRFIRLEWRLRHTTTY